jgi:hypothetical protein
MQSTFAALAVSLSTLAINNAVLAESLNDP